MKKMILILATVMLFFSASALADEPSAAADPFHFTVFRDVVIPMAEGDAYTVSDGYAVAVINRDGHCYRVVASFDERAEEMYSGYLEDGDFSNDEFSVLSDYVKALPVQYTEELAVTPFTQEELDAMAGKTIEEVMTGPWEILMCNYPEYTEPGQETVFPMVKGFCEYELVINEPSEVYQERRAGDRFDPVTVMSLRNYLDLTVKCVRYTGISSFHALDLRYQADGTFKSDIEPIPEDYNYGLMEEIADYLTAVWENLKPDQEMKDAMIAALTEKHPEAAEMIRQIVGSFH